MTWTHNGAPLGPKPRPWRLTRRQRVEMEAALAGLRGGGGSNFYGWVMAADRAASVWGRPGLARFTVDELERWGRIGGLGKRAYEGAARITRARVAIALRAALRADEDARCEAVTDDLRDDMGSDVDDVLERVREWPPLRCLTGKQWMASGDAPDKVADHRAHGFVAWVADEDSGDVMVCARLPVRLALWERAR